MVSEIAAVSVSVQDVVADRALGDTEDGKPLSVEAMALRRRGDIANPLLGSTTESGDSANCRPSVCVPTDGVSRRHHL